MLILVHKEVRLGNDFMKKYVYIHSYIQYRLLYAHFNMLMKNNLFSVEELNRFVFTEEYMNLGVV